MGSIYDWSTTASDNGNSDATVNYAEGQTPASLNNSARAAMARVAAWLKSLGAAITHGGSSNAYTLTLPTGHQVTAYATGMRFLWKPNGNSSGSVTLNVDGVGAKKVFLPSGSQAGSGHITSGTLLDVVYDATLDSSAGGFQIVGSSSALASQPLDATLTALAALSWSSGNALVQFTAADTVSLTLAPSVTSVTASNGAAASTPAGRFVNTTDNATNVPLVVASDRATPANFDLALIGYEISNASGTQIEVVRAGAMATTTTAGAETGRFYIYTRLSGGTLTGRIYVDATSISPVTNDGISIGSSGAAMSDGWWAAGAVHNFGASNVVLTHNNAAASLEVTTGAFTARIPRSSETSGTLTVASRNRIVACSGGVTLPASVFTADDVVGLDPGTSSRTITRGASLTMYLNGTDVASATLAANQMGYAYYRSATVVVLSGAFS